MKYFTAYKQEYLTQNTDSRQTPSLFYPCTTEHQAGKPQLEVKFSVSHMTLDVDI